MTRTAKPLKKDAPLREKMRRRVYLTDHPDVYEVVGSDGSTPYKVAHLHDPERLICSGTSSACMAGPYPPTGQRAACWHRIRVFKYITRRLAGGSTRVRSRGRESAGRAQGSPEDHSPKSAGGIGHAQP